MPSEQQGTVIRQPGPYCYTFSPDHKPIAEVSPGQVVTLVTADAFENRITSPTDSFSDAIQYPYMNPQVGPIFVKGAEPGDTLVVTIHDIVPDRDFAVTGLVPNFGGLTGTDLTAVLNDPLPEQVRILPIEDGCVVFNDRIRIPCRPFMGTIAVAPQIESINCLTPGRYGGNMDCADVCSGNKVLLPVFVEGALFMTGDGHAAQGDGEITGVACEVSAKVTVSFEVIKGRTVGWPRIISDEAIMAVGSARPLEDAVRTAYKELLVWMMEDYGFDKWDAYHLLGQVGLVRLCNMCDPNYSVAAKIPRKYLP